MAETVNLSATESQWTDKVITQKLSENDQVINDEKHELEKWDKDLDMD